MVMRWIEPRVPPSLFLSLISAKVVKTRAYSVWDWIPTNRIGRSSLSLYDSAPTNPDQHLGPFSLGTIAVSTGQSVVLNPVMTTENIVSDRNSRHSWGQLVRGQLVRGRLVRGFLVRGRLVRGQLVRGRLVRGQLVRGRLNGQGTDAM